MSDIVWLLLLLGLLAGFWLDQQRAWEQARTVGERACRERGVQWLDETVALERLWWRRDRDGRVRWERTYRFEYSTDGRDRQPGRLVLVGQRVELLTLPPAPPAPPALTG